MKIALIGYGKMGKEIESAALKRGHTVVLKVASKNNTNTGDKELQEADVAIEFSTPHTVIKHMQLCFDSALPVVVGTTGWNDQLNEMKQACLNKRRLYFMLRISALA